MNMIKKEKHYVDNFLEDEGVGGKGVPLQSECHSNPISDPLIS